MSNPIESSSSDARPPKNKGGRPRGSGKNQRAAAALAKTDAVQEIQKAAEELPAKIAADLPPAIVSPEPKKAPEENKPSSSEGSNKAWRNRFWFVMRGR